MNHYLPKLDLVGALVRRAHEDDSIGGVLDGTVRL